MAKSAPAAHLATRWRASVSWSGESGCFSGNAATPTQKSPRPRTIRTSSAAWDRPCGCGTHRPPGPPGGSPRNASTLRTPTPAYCSITLRSSARLWPTAVRWPTGVSVVSVAMRSVTRIVRSRVDPPAPYVTDTNVGRSASSSRIASQSWRSPSSVLGGKNSKENDGRPVPSSSRTVGVLTGRTLWAAPMRRAYAGHDGPRERFPAGSPRRQPAAARPRRTGMETGMEWSQPHRALGRGREHPYRAGPARRDDGPPGRGIDGEVDPDVGRSGVDLDRVGAARQHDPHLPGPAAGGHPPWWPPETQGHRAGPAARHHPLAAQVVTGDRAGLGEEDQVALRAPQRDL